MQGRCCKVNRLLSYTATGHMVARSGLGNWWYLSLCPWRGALGPWDGRPKTYRDPHGGGWIGRQGEMLVFQPSSSIHSFIHTKCRLPQLPHCSAQLYLLLLIKAILRHLCFPRLWLLGSNPCLCASMRCFKANCSGSALTAWFCPSHSPLSFYCCCWVNP